MKIIVMIIPTDLVTHSILLYFCPFLERKNKNQIFSKLVVKIFVFCFKQVALFFKAMPNSIDFYKRIFLHLISVCVIVP